MLLLHVGQPLAHFDGYIYAVTSRHSGFDSQSHVEGVVAAEPLDLTSLLKQWSAGDPDARDRLMALVYDRLRQIARARLRDAPDERSLDTTALVHEAYLRLADSPGLTLVDQAHFLALASRVMRHLLLDRVRRRAALRNAGAGAFIELDDTLWIPDETLDIVEELDAALAQLEALNPRQSEILQQRYFGGLSLEETAAAIGVSVATVKRELRSARAWLALTLAREREL